MTTRYLSTTPRYSSLLALFGLGVFVAQGCGNDSNPAPTPPTVTGGTAGSGGSGAKGGSGGKGGSGNSGNESGNGPEGGTGDTGANGGSGGKGGSSAKGGGGGKGGSGAKGGTGSGNTGNTGNTGNEGGSGNESGANNGGAGAGNVSCDPVGQYQCFPCPPTTNVEYLNRCNDTSCSKFDNATRIQNFNGTLPPL